MIKIILFRLSDATIRWIAVPVAFAMTRLVQDQLFLRNLDNGAFPPSRSAWPLVVLARATGAAGRLYRAAFTDFALRRYAHYVKRHYSKGGRGYFAYDGMGAEEKKALFGQPDGRVAGFIDAFPDLVGYADGDSFFDAGCGRGQNTKVLMDRFPTSPIVGIDISAEAVDIIHHAVQDDRLQCRAADITDPAVLGDIVDDAYDHVVMSHVFSVIFGEGTTATHDLRKRIIQQLARIAGKSLLIIDGPAVMRQTARFRIEQRDRGIFEEFILPYFEGAPGSVVILKSGDSFGFLYRPQRAATPDDGR